MEHKSMKGMRVLPLCAVALMATASVSMLLSGNSTELNAATNSPVKTADYQINGREYQQDGIIYDVPNVDDASRDAAVVYFPNRAVIPSHINVDGIEYTVTKIRSGSTQTDIDDSNGWITLPPTLKWAGLSESYIYQTINYNHIAYTYGVQNVSITNLDSFLNLDYFNQEYQIVAYSFKPSLKGNWKLYLNGVRLTDYDYVYPEGSPMGTSLNGLLGVRSITVPASDTARTKPLCWAAYSYMNQGPYPGKVQFKADSGYDLRYYNINAATLVLPRKTTEFHGYGTLCANPPLNVKAVQWSDCLKIIDSTDGLSSPVYLDRLPESLVKIGNVENKKMELRVGDTATLHSNLEQIENLCLKGTSRIKQVNIQDSDKPLVLNSEVTLTPVASSPTFYFGREIVLNNSNCYFEAVVNNKKSATIIFGANVAELPELSPVRLADNQDKQVSPWRIVCQGLTPPEFPTENPAILDWKDDTELFVPEAAVEAYRNHPVWGQFRTIQTTSADQIQMEREVVSERWISLDGRTLEAPETGRVNIQVTTYSDGTTDTRKVAVPEK